MSDPEEALREAQENASHLDSVWSAAAEALEKAEEELTHWAENEGRRRDALTERIDGLQRRCDVAAERYRQAVKQVRALEGLAETDEGSAL